MNNEKISGKISLGVLGEKLPHTLSPAIHADLFQQQNLEGEYKVYEMTPEEVQKLPEFMEEHDLLGLNVTIPYKEVVFPMMDVLDASAEQIGAINTIFRKDGKLYGYNTDYIGVLSMFKKAGVVLEGKSIVILGSGGAAKALIYAFHVANAAKITIAARNEKEKARLCTMFPYLNTCGLDEIEGGDIIINTTPVGMFPNVGKSVVDASVIGKFQIAADIVYNPLMTEFLNIAKAEGLQVVTGLMMLVDQAIGAEEIWFEKELDYHMGDRVHDELASRFR